MTHHSAGLEDDSPTSTTPFARPSLLAIIWSALVRSPRVWSKRTLRRCVRLQSTSLSRASVLVLENASAVRAKLLLALGAVTPSVQLA
jgi:hypothetical protein